MPDLISQLQQMLAEYKHYFPDNDSQQAGYQEAIEDVIAFVEKSHVVDQKID